MHWKFKLKGLVDFLLCKQKTVDMKQRKWSKKKTPQTFKGDSEQN